MRSPDRAAPPRRPARGGARRRSARRRRAWAGTPRRGPRAFSCSKRSTSRIRQPLASHEQTPLREAVHVEERQHGEVAVLRGDPPRLDQRARVGGEVAVGEHRPLGAARRARRVDDGGRRPARVDPAGSDRARRIRRRPADPSSPARPAPRDDGPRARPRPTPASPAARGPPAPASSPPPRAPRRATMWRDLALAVEDVDRDEDRPRASGRPGTGRGTRGGSRAGRRGGPRPAARAPARTRRHAARPGLDLAEGQGPDGPSRRAEIEPRLVRPVRRATPRRGRAGGLVSPAETTATPAPLLAWGSVPP